MTQEIFKRYEKKYMLTQKQYDALMPALERQMDTDHYGEYTISNIYFDTPDFQLVRQSIEKPEYKEKLRLRAYGKATDTSVVYAELKKKFDGVVYKRRIPVPLCQARKYLYYGIRRIEESQILKEIEYVLNRYDLRPAAFVAYDRAAYYGKGNEELRITFDRNICCRCSGLDLKNGVYGTMLLDKDQILMEVKIPGAMPLWMSRLFSDMGLFPVSYSKYGAYYKEYLYQGIFIEGGRICA